MNEDNVKGSLQKVGGRVEEAAGVLVGDHELKQAGREDQLKGTVREAWGNVTDAGHALVDHARAVKYEAEAEAAKADAHAHTPVVVEKDTI